MALRDKPVIHVLFCPKCKKLTDQEDYGLTYDKKNIIIYRKCIVCENHIEVTIDHTAKDGGYKSKIIKKDDIPEEFMTVGEHCLWYVI